MLDELEGLLDEDERDWEAISKVMWSPRFRVFGHYLGKAIRKKFKEEYQRYLEYKRSLT